ncbi:MAG: hypothetical protein Q8P02_04930 [Candidatus Micrarchaeota archaeon]|nr:hypothetical protein [Candidatus Micrarchaeota archaeon]
MAKLKGQLPDLGPESVAKHLIGQLTGAGRAMPHYAAKTVKNGRTEQTIHIVGHAPLNEEAGAERDMLKSKLGVHGTVSVQVADIYTALQRLGVNVERVNNVSNLGVATPGRATRTRLLVAALTVTPKGQAPNPENATRLEIYASGVQRPITAKALRRFSRAKVPGTLTVFASRKPESGEKLMNVMVRGGQASQSTRVGDVVQGGNNQRVAVQEWILNHASAIKGVLGETVQGMQRDPKKIKLAVILHAAKS